MGKWVNSRILKNIIWLLNDQYSINSGCLSNNIYNLNIKITVKNPGRDRSLSNPVKYYNIITQYNSVETTRNIVSNESYNYLLYIL